jgi:hypothetical protein
MTLPLVQRLAEALRQFDPNAPELDEVPCRQCGGIGEGLIWKGYFQTEWFTCSYCDGKGSGRGAMSLALEQSEKGESMTSSRGTH